MGLAMRWNQYAMLVLGPVGAAVAELVDAQR